VYKLLTYSTSDTCSSLVNMLAIPCDVTLVPTKFLYFIFISAGYTSVQYIFQDFCFRGVLEKLGVQTFSQYD